MNDHNEALQAERDAHAAARRGRLDRLRRAIERLGAAYGGDYSEVLTAYRHAAQAAHRRVKQLEEQTLQAKHDAWVAYYELRHAMDIIDELSRTAAADHTSDEGSE